MKRIPKTPVEFDYDLWTTEDGKCMVRVKLTGEVTEVAREVMKILRAEEKKLRRSFTGEASEDGEDGNETVLSLDALPDDDVHSSLWMEDPINDIEAFHVELLEAELIRSLTDVQRDIYISCIIGGETPTAYAKAHNIKRQSVCDAIALIRKKAKKIFQ